MTDAEIIRFIVTQFEGGYVNDPDDRGGATRWGVTRETLAEFRGVPQTDDDVRALSREDADHILLDLYVMRPNFWQIADWKLRLAVVDFAIHSGVRTASRALQQAVGVRVDGSVGRDTLWAVARADAERVRLKVIGARLRHLGRLISRVPSQARFASGWYARVATVLEAA